MSVGYVSSAESQKGINAVQQSSVEIQKGAITIYFVYSSSPLVVLNGTSLNSINSGIALN